MLSENIKPVLFMMGPTGAGKTRLAVELVQKLPLEIISVDSAMVYRDMNIGTAKPAADIQRIAPHHLIDICDPAEPYSAARFREDALATIQKIHNRHRIPLLVGGTGLYFRSLEHGLSQLPGADPELRKRMNAEARNIGWKAMHERLGQIDPVAAARIHPNDPQRIQRALEVYELTKKPLSQHFNREIDSTFPYQVFKIVINPVERGIIHERVKIRFHEMLDRGLVDEVRDLWARGDLGPALPSIRTVGYRQIWQYLDKQLEYGQMVEKAIVATRQLAKRQLTWFRKVENACWYDSEAKGVTANVLNYIEGISGMNSSKSARISQNVI